MSEIEFLLLIGFCICMIIFLRSKTGQRFRDLLRKQDWED